MDLISIFGPKPLLVHAHPDDESIFTGHLVSKLVDLGGSPEVLCLTGGELRQASSPKSPSAPGSRIFELQKALDALGATGAPRLATNGTQDSGMRINLKGLPKRSLRFNFKSLVNRSPGLQARKYALAAKDSGYSSIVTYDSDGFYGHPDHIWAHNFSKFLRAEFRGLGLEIDLWEISKSPEYSDIEVRAYSGSRKLEALQCHASQVNLHQTETDVKFVAGGREMKISDSEYFRRIPVG